MTKIACLDRRLAINTYHAHPDILGSADVGGGCTKNEGLAPDCLRPSASASAYGAPHLAQYSESAASGVLHSTHILPLMLLSALSLPLSMGIAGFPTSLPIS